MKPCSHLEQVNLGVEGKIVVVTGSASWIGFENSLLLVKNGFRTYATVRNSDKVKTVRDISDKAAVDYYARNRKT
jgi:NAD(P)-dependent dehydrogenase (short-subunit alcohol dehydrogenase family)